MNFSWLRILGQARSLHKFLHKYRTDDLQMKKEVTRERHIGGSLKRETRINSRRRSLGTHCVYHFEPVNTFYEDDY